MNTVNTDVINYAQYIGCGVFGKTLFYGRVPDSNKTPVALWWIAPGYATQMNHNATGEDTIDYNFELKYRDVSLQNVDQELFRITKEIVGSHCYSLDNYRTMDIRLISANPRFTVDMENRVIGAVTFAVRVYNILSPTTQDS